MFDKYFISTTPIAVFNGLNRVEGGGDTTLEKYWGQVNTLLGQQSAQPSSVLLRSGVASSNNKIRANVTLQNLSAVPLSNVVLYAVIYEKVVFSDSTVANGTEHNVVRGVTPAITIDSLDAGAVERYQLQHDSLSYDINYGVMIILKSPSGQIIQAYQAR